MRDGEFDFVNAPVVGVDGARGGWLAVFADASGNLAVRRVGRFAEILEAVGERAVVAVDMPIGLPTAAMAGGRSCDRAARRLLGRRASCVFSPPARASLGAADYAEALAINRGSAPDAVGLSRQTFGLFRLLRDVDCAVRPDLQRRVVEAHPELSFRMMSGTWLTTSKKTAQGRAERRELLVRHGFARLSTVEAARPPGAGPDDLLDACALCWTARRIRAGCALRLPSRPPRDASGLRMEIWA